MGEAFFRLVLENKQTNYAFLCGGTIHEIIEYMRAEDTKRNDGNLVANELEQLFAQGFKFDDNNREQFFVKPYENGLVASLFYEGASSEPAQVDDPQANLLLKALFSAFKPPEDPNESH